MLRTASHRGTCTQSLTVIYINVNVDFTNIIVVNAGLQITFSFQDCSGKTITVNVDFSDTLDTQLALTTIKSELTVIQITVRKYRC